MKFELAFLEEAQKEWRKLDATIWAQLKERLSERLEHPPVPASKLCCHPDRYKIKLPSVGGAVGLRGAGQTGIGVGCCCWQERA
jgi:mRNA interferase RelE/StbE